MTDLQLLCLRMADELDHYRQLLSDDRREVHCLAVEARAAVAAAADGPAVPAGREPAAVAGEPSDREMLELMPKIMLEEFSHAAQVCSDATGGQVKPGIFRVCLNTAALEYAKAVLARWGRPATPPAPAEGEVGQP